MVEGVAPQLQWLKKPRQSEIVFATKMRCCGAPYRNTPPFCEDQNQ